MPFTVQFSQMAGLKSGFKSGSQETKTPHPGRFAGKTRFQADILWRIRD